MRGEGHRYKRLKKNGKGHHFGITHNHRTKSAMLECPECRAHLRLLKK